MEFFSKHYKNLVSGITGYYSQDTLYILDRKSEQFKFTSSDINLTIPHVLIVSREYYQELSKSYPIVEKKDLIKLLKLEYQGLHVCFKINSVDVDKSNVTIWLFSDSLPKTQLVLPESYVLFKAIGSEQLVTIDCLNKSELFIGSRSRGVVSSYKNNVISSIELFASSVGIAPTCIERGNKGNLANLLMSGLYNCRLSDISTFYRKPSQDGLMLFVKSSLIPALSVISFYLLISSLWLMWQKTSLEHEFLTNKQEVNAALSLQLELDQKVAQFNQLNEFIATQQAKSEVWFVLAEILNNTSLTTLRYTDGRFTILGQTTKTTDLMTRLMSHPQVEDAKFDSPSRKLAELESFDISFVLRKKINKVDPK